jgi:cytoskeletal protein CcmA (bactofilin family)
VSGGSLFQRRAADRADRTEGPWTVLSAESSVRGEIRGRHPVRIEGTFDGTIQIEGVLHVSQGAVVTGELAAAHIIVEGKVEGNLAATGRVEFRATANMRGDTRAGRVVVEERAIVNGRIEMTEGPVLERPAERRGG